MLRIDYSPQGNPEPRTVATSGALPDIPAAAPLGSIAAAGGGFILIRKNRNTDSLAWPLNVPPSDGT